MKKATSSAMLAYLAIIEDAGPDVAVGVWFPDLPGCFSAGETVEEAIVNAREAVALFLEEFPAEGRAYPRARSVRELRDDPEYGDDVARDVVALIPFEPPARAAAE